MKKELRLELLTSFKSIEIEDSDELVITGLANAQTVDRVGDIILEEAYNKGGLVNYLKNPIILFNHDYSQPIGKTIGISVGSDGLTVTAKISKAAGRVYDLIKEGIIKSFSVGFMVKEADYDVETDLFAIKDIELLEVSAVAVPANQDSVFSVSKAFKTDEEELEYKKQFASTNDANTDVDNIVNTVESTETSVDNANIEEINMTPEELKALQDKMDAMTAELKSTKGNLAAAEDMLDDVAVKEAKAKADEASVQAKIEVKSQVEDLIKDVEARFKDERDTLAETLKGLQTDLKDKAEEITALTKSKMRFEDNSSRETFTKTEKDNAVLVAKLLGKDIERTKFFTDIVQKSGLEHTPSADWEQEFNTSIFNDMKEKLILEPLFQTIAMNTPSMQIPINPEAGDAEWIATASFRSSNDASTGTAVDHKMSETTLVAHKLASKEYIGYEEEEDTILAIVPIIRDAVTRRMARTSDQSLLRGTGLGAGGDAVSPFEGLTAIAGANTVDVAVAAKWTVDNLQAVRRGLGARGLNPGEVKYIVSEDAYYDLLEDPDFRTMDLVGTNATILKGMVASVNGSPVIVSDSFEAKAATKAAVVAVYTPNFFVGNLRSMMVERDVDIINQKRVIVATRRMGFIDMITGEGVAIGGWIA